MATHEELRKEWTRKRFWDEIVCVPESNGVRHLVGRIADDEWHHNSSDSQGNQVVTILENPYYDSDYNVILSLCTDGQHRLCMDVDHAQVAVVQIFGEDMLAYGKPGANANTLNVGRAGTITLVPSTRHWHAYGTKPIKWAWLHGLLLAVDTKYAAASMARGFSVLRTPWCVKDGSGDPEPPKGKSLAELLDEEDGPIF